MNLVIVLIRFRKVLTIEEQSAKAVGGAQFKLGVHLDRFEGADLDADLAAHAHGDIDIEASRVDLHLSHEIRLLVGGLDDIDALRRTLFFADLAGHATQTGHGVSAVIYEERKVAGVLDRRNPLFGILHRR